MVAGARFNSLPVRVAVPGGRLVVVARQDDVALAPELDVEIADGRLRRAHDPVAPGTTTAFTGRLRATRTSRWSNCGAQPTDLLRFG